MNKDNISIIPVPSRMKLNKGVFRLDSNSRINNDRSLDTSANQFRSFVEETGGIRIGKKSSAANIETSIELELSSSEDGGNQESYAIKITPSKISIKAPAAAGVFYGVQTLKQIILERMTSNVSSIDLPCLEIEDGPRFEWRGFLLDSSRHFQDIATIKKLIDALALYKINRLHWHFNDNNSWRFKSEKYPGLARFIRGISNDRGCYTAKQMREVVRYAAERLIMGYPELEMPGHSQAALSIMSQLKCHGISNNTVVNEYCIGRKETEKFNKAIIREIETIFPAPYIHIGGDEADDSNWKFCKYCKAAMKEKGLKNTKMFQKDFMNRMAEYVHSRNKTSIAWADKLSLGIPEGQIVQGWFDNKESYEAASNGFKTINSYHRGVYLDYPQSVDENRYHWMLDLPVKEVYGFDPMPTGLSAEQEKLVLGSEACLWTELVPQEKVFQKIFPRLWAFAEIVWSEKTKLDFESFLKRNAVHCGIFDRLGYDFFT